MAQDGSDFTRMLELDYDLFLIKEYKTNFRSPNSNPNEGEVHVKFDLEPKDSPLISPDNSIQ